MRGLRRFCVGISLLMFACTSPLAKAQAPSATEGMAGGYAWPPAGISPQQAFNQPIQQAGGWPMPMMNAEQAGVMPVQFQQFSPPPGPPGMANGFAGPGNSLNPYPGLDMYRYGYQETVNENGLWFSRKLNANRDFNFSIEFMQSVYDSPGSSLLGYGGISTGIGSTDGIPSWLLSNPRDPGTVTTTGAGGGGGGNNGGNATAFSQSIVERYFPVRTFDSMFGNNGSTGLKIGGGFEDEDGSGIMVSTWYGGESTEVFTRGAVPIRSYNPSLDPFDFVGNDPAYIAEVNALNGGLSINAGSGVAETIPFDLLYEVQFSQEAWGAGLQILRPAIWQSSWYQVRPVLGLRYFDIREGFAFRGLDTGAEYEFINFQDIDAQQEVEGFFDADFPFGGGGIDDAELGLEGRPVGDTFNDDDTIPFLSNVYPLDLFPTNPYETQIAASNHARAAGPEIGLRTDIGGGDNFKLMFLATAGLTATSETTRLNGFGVYNHFANRIDPDSNIDTPDGGEIGTGVGGLTDAETAFEDRNTNTHVSPTFDLVLSMELRLFEYIPLLNQVEVLENAKFTSSYGFLYVGNITRPQDSVSYDSFPINPSIKPDRSGWTMQSWTFGVDWTY